MHGPPGDFKRVELWKDSREALRGIDPVLDKCMDELPGNPKVRLIDDAFTALVSGFCHLVVSAEIGERHWHRLLEQNGNQLPTATDIVEMADRDLQKCIAVNKHATNLKEIALAIAEDPSLLPDFSGMNDSDIEAHMLQFKGVGPWLAKWMLMYHLGRPDVLLERDASLKRAVKNKYGFEKTPSDADLRTISAAWEGHRSAACWYVFMAAEEAADSGDQD